MSKQKSKCQDKSRGVRKAGRVTGHDYLGDDEENMKLAVYYYGAVAVTFNAHGRNFQNYKYKDSRS